ADGGMRAGRESEDHIEAAYKVAGCVPVFRLLRRDFDQPNTRVIGVLPVDLRGYRAQPLDLVAIGADFRGPGSGNVLLFRGSGEGNGNVLLFPGIGECETNLRIFANLIVLMGALVGEEINRALFGPNEGTQGA